MRRDHPRSRGEYGYETPEMFFKAGSSPLSRGILLHRFWPVPEHGIIPALAGNTRTLEPPPPWRWDHPRSRGEYQVITAQVKASDGSSPLSRGIPSAAMIITQAGRIIPALAGNTLVGGNPGVDWGDHPRSRGEYGSGLFKPPNTFGSSPLSRGIHHLRHHILTQPRIIPALAGNTELTPRQPT